MPLCNFLEDNTGNHERMVPNKTETEEVHKNEASIFCTIHPNISSDITSFFISTSI